jgi:hypothetical protein
VCRHDYRRRDAVLEGIPVADYAYPRLELICGKERELYVEVVKEGGE